MACVTATMATPALAAKVDTGTDGVVEFAGRTWIVKERNEAVGPGPNFFAGENVWVDRKGNLHLRIVPANGRWTTAEVYTEATLGYGQFTYTVKSRVGRLDPNVVLGMFTWDEGAPPYYSEIDMEVAKFGDADRLTNAEYVVQPYNEPGNRSPFLVANRPNTAFTMNWSADVVEFSSVERGRTRSFWSFDDASAIPVPGDARARINLWLFQGKAPTDGQPVEIIVSDFQHILN